MAIIKEQNLFNRLHSLDYLRGLVAFSIMIYHFLSWSIGRFEAESFIGRIGLYGVSIFYVLSGLTLYLVYYDKMKPNYEDVISFFKKRIFRIFPLLWIVTIVSIFLSKQMPDPTLLILNLTGLFGFVRWDECFSAGIWSIGNELVFYVFFPFFILFTKKHRMLMTLLVISLLALYIYFAFVKLSPESTLSEQWKNYVNPLNQAFLFLGGFLIGLFIHNRNISNKIILLILTFSVLLFTYHPVSGNTINLVTGFNRLIFTTCSFLICICVYKLKFKFTDLVHLSLTKLGEASYSLYLLHPIIWTIVGITLAQLGKLNIMLPTTVRLFISILITLFASYFTFQYFEKFFMKFGRSHKSPQ
jgi:exopolysaccharide production protein ExoZ